MTKLKNIELFRGLSDQATDVLHKMARRVEVQDGNALIEESAKGDSVFAIIAGRVSIHISMPDGKESDSLAMLGEGDIIGESILLGRTRRIASAVANDEVIALEWSASGLLQHLENNPAVGYTIMRNLARIIHDRLTAMNMMLRNTINQVVDIMR